MTAKQRFRTSLLGVVTGLIAVPILMSSWAPWWATTAWSASYAVMAVVALVFILRESELVEYWWSVGHGVLVGSLPVTAYVFAPGTRAIWIAACIAFITVALEVSTLPFLPTFQWRLGPAILGTLVTVAVVLEIGIVGLCLVPVFALILRNGTQMRRDKTALQESVDAAESKSAWAQQIAANDDLTGLLNRRGLAMELERLRLGGDYSVVMFDANRFKAINDAHGHGAGDQALQGMAAAIAERLPAPWVVARQGGDEFVAVAAGHDRRVDPAICDPVVCNVSMFGVDTAVDLSVSAGLVRADAGDTVDEALNKAGYAMREAKRQSGGLVRFTDDLATRFEWMQDISGAGLDPAAFDPDFQIIVDCDGVVVGCEALCRWRRADGSTLRPDQFLPILSEIGMMPLLNELMLEKGVAFASRMNDLEDAPFVTINISSSHLGSKGLVPHVVSLLDTYAVDPNRIMIEITENEFLDDEAPWHSDALALQDLGLHLAIDDFGAGYSNIDRLNTLPVTDLKFDRSLASSVSGPIGKVVQGVVKFAAAADIGIIAEGIETEDELQAMEDIGVRLFQGFMFGRPTAADEVEARVRSQRGRSSAATLRAA